ncbi:basic salivary proline-rich protein 2-like [Enhydra lutris kenyoni]|uniref:Basic salivary proline-rich protein 2-like n=1 Tax=Enhydra lutris kenyoni TaxID=391180 RepID=A0A2Y9L4Z7_ENHLU|nr:basic salivary proline-rich protein 2-like [Enhydra lutris kenyoni]
MGGILCLDNVVQGRSSQVRRLRKGPSVRAGDPERRAFLAWPRCPAWASGIPAAAPIGRAQRARRGPAGDPVVPANPWGRCKGPSPAAWTRLAWNHPQVDLDTASNKRPARRRHHLWEALRHCASVRYSRFGPRAPPPGPGALNRCRAPRGHSGRARGGGSSCAVIRPGTKARPPVLGQVNTRFVMEMSAGQPEQMIRGLGKRRPRPGAGEGSGAGAASDWCRDTVSARTPGSPGAPRSPPALPCMPALRSRTQSRRPRPVAGRCRTFPNFPKLPLRSPPSALFSSRPPPSYRAPGPRPPHLPRQAPPEEGAALEKERPRGPRPRDTARAGRRRADAAAAPRVSFPGRVRPLQAGSTRRGWRRRAAPARPRVSPRASAGLWPAGEPRGRSRGPRLGSGEDSRGEHFAGM